ncbi:MAG: ATP-binding protein [Polyangiaceae bacterium]
MTGARKGASEQDDARDALLLVGEIAAEIAHELRNALQVVSSSAFVARTAAERGDAAGALAHIVKVETSARTAHSIVDGLMGLARGEVPHLEPVALTAVIAGARSDMAGGVATWIDEIAPADLPVRAHAGLLVRLFHALYDNAVAVCAPRRPSVTTRAHLEGWRVVVEVSDDGPGVAPEIAPRIFEPLVTSRTGGTGLGLALAARIAQAHGGTIDLVGTGRGATFRVELPGA